MHIYLDKSMISAFVEGEFCSKVNYSLRYRWRLVCYYFQRLQVL